MPQNTYEILLLLIYVQEVSLTKLEHILIEHDPDIMVIVEIWLHDFVVNGEIVPAGYKIFRKDWGIKSVAIIARHDLDCTTIEDSKQIESIWCTLKLSNIKIMIRTIYRPPNFSFDILEKLKEFLVKMRVSTRNVIISKYFNVPSIDWDA